MTTPSASSSGPVSALRIGTVERNAAIRCLDEHLSAGRIDADEYAGRMATASLARTRGEIEPLFLDLPAPHPFQPPTAALRWHESGALSAPWLRLAGLSDWSRAVLAAVVALLISLILGLTTVAVAAASHDFGSSRPAGPAYHQGR